MNTGLYSDWFAMLPLLSQDDSKDGYDWFSVKATVKEANPRGISTRKMLDFFSDNGRSLQDLMKGVLSSARN